jgi:hypothetical protein
MGQTARSGCILVLACGPSGCRWCSALGRCAVLRGVSEGYSEGTRVVLEGYPAGTPGRRRAGVRYFEVRFAPQLHCDPNSDFDVIAVIKATPHLPACNAMLAACVPRFVGVALFDSLAAPPASACCLNSQPSCCIGARPAKVPCAHGIRAPALMRADQGASSWPIGEQAVNKAPRRICTGTGLTPRRICPGTGLTPRRICAETGLAPAHMCAGTGLRMVGRP